MTARLSAKRLNELDALVDGVLRSSRIPGAAIAVVEGAKTIYARGFGYLDLPSRRPANHNTAYPIASTTKALTATLLALLVEDGRLEWDAPVQRYLPRFRLKDEAISGRVTLRDLITMRTGLPRHDWMWIGNPMSRLELAERLAYLDLSADLRQRFQYCNLTVTLAGYVAEVVTGQAWEELILKRILRPLGMRKTCFDRPKGGNVTLSYHENIRRRLVLSPRLSAEPTAPSGGAIYSTVTDMARWLAFNLSGGVVSGRRLISARSLSEVHSPHMVIGVRPLAPLPPDASYGLGWVIHYYQGQKYISHGGNLHQVNSSVMFFPEKKIGIVCFTNFGPPALAEIINLHTFDLLNGSTPAQSVSEKLAQYEAQVDETRSLYPSVAAARIKKPSHLLGEYVGTYRHAAYGQVKIQRRGRGLWLRRPGFALPLRHWHYDVWVPQDSSMWPIHKPHPLGRASKIHFQMNSKGNIVSLSIPFESEAPPIRFEKREG